MKNLIKKMSAVLKDKKLIIFDLDGTLTETKSNMDEEMTELFSRLLKIKQVAVIGGGKYEVFQSQFLAKLYDMLPEILNRLYIFPASGTSFYKYKNNLWSKVYAHKFSPDEKKKIFKAFGKTFKEIDYKNPKKTYGRIIEDRGTQITFSALGQDIVAELGKKGVKLKKKWRDKNQNLKLKLTKTLQKYLPEFEVRAAGYTSIDVTPKGVDKEYGIKQINKELGVTFEDMLFVGDALFSGGNDEPVLGTGVLCFEVKNTQDTKKLLKYLLSK